MMVEKVASGSSSSTVNVLQDLNVVLVSYKFKWSP